MPTRLLFLLLLQMTWVPAAFGQTTRPTTAPAVDLSTPRSALQALSTAMRDGDVDLLKRLLWATTPAERQMASAVSDMSSALADLHRAAAKAYGEERAGTMTGNTTEASNDAHARIENSDISVAGDTATVIYKDEKDAPFVLKKVQGEWKVPMAEFSKPVNAAALDQRIAELSVQTKLMRQIAQQIGEGKFPTPEQATQAWHTRMLQATSQPAGSPSAER